MTFNVGDRVRCEFAGNPYDGIEGTITYVSPYKGTGYPYAVEWDSFPSHRYDHGGGWSDRYLCSINLNIIEDWRL